MTGREKISIANGVIQQKPSFASSFLMFLSFNLCFFALQLALVYSQATIFVSAIKMPWRVYGELIATLIVHSGLYILLSLIQAYLLEGILKRKRYYFSIEQWQVIIWSLFTCAILCANAYYFPLSAFSKIISPPITAHCLLIVLVLATFLIGLLIINGLAYLKNFSLFLLLSAIVYMIMHDWSQPDKIINHHTQPNIIILGIDSLSLDNVNKENTPFLYHHLKNSTQFTNTISPLARTFPAWCSILTGLYVKHHHADENLVSKGSVKREASIVWSLNQLGYYTVFASDDRRFNGLDKQFGFQQVIGPKLGVNDFLIGSFNDFPLGNLIINSPIAAWLFPYNYMNRASYFSYYPQTFNATLQKKLLQIKQYNKPIFLAVHFTLPHWPYAWAESLPELVMNEFSFDKKNILYKSALLKVDQQFEALYNFLKENYFFNTSLVLTLSDHGEVLYNPNSRATNYSNYQGKLPSVLDEYLRKKTATQLDKSAGHGSDLLSPEQYHSILAFNIRNQGRLCSPKANISTRTALIDIAPTIMDFIKQSRHAKMDGLSLLASILNPKDLPKKRSFFIESGMFPNQNISERQALQIGKKIFKINPDNGELELKAKELKQINKEKLYGILKDDWILALYPNDTTYIAVIQNLKTGQWIDDLDSAFAQTSPALKLLHELRQFYGDLLTLN